MTLAPFAVTAAAAYTYVSGEDGAEAPASDVRSDGKDVLQGLIRTFTGGDRGDPVRVLQDVAAAFGVPNGSVIMDFVEGFLADLSASVRNGLQAAAAQLRSESRTEALAPSVDVVDDLIARAMPEIVVRVREAMRTHLSFVEQNKTHNAREAAAASAAEAAATNVVPAASARPGAVAAGDTSQATAQTTGKSAKPSLPPKKKAAPGGLGLGGGLKKKPATAKTGAGAPSAGAPAAPAAPGAVSAAANPMQQMMGMLGGGGGAGAGSNPLSGLLGGLMGGRPQQPEAPLNVDEVLATEIQVPEERMMWRSTMDQMESMAAARGSNGAPELPPLGDAYLAAIPSGKSGGSALDQIFDI